MTALSTAFLTSFQNGNTFPKAGGRTLFVSYTQHFVHSINAHLFHAKTFMESLLKAKHCA